MTPKRLIIQIPLPTFLYINMAFSLRAALMRRGIEVHIQLAGLSADAERALLSAFRPDVIFSINDSRSEVCREHPDIRFITWVQDNQFVGEDMSNRFADAETDDIVYFAGGRQASVFNVGSRYQIGSLYFAAEPVPETLPESPLLSETSMIGFQPTIEILNAVFMLPNGRHFHRRDYFQFLHLLQEDSVDFPLEMLDQIVDTFLGMYGCSAGDIDPPEALHIYKEELIRASNRLRLVQHVLQQGFSCRIFGPGTWAEWPEVSAHYCGEAPTIEDARAIYRSTAFNLHNGGITHPRVYDCLAARGGLLLTNRSMHGDAFNEFEPGVHYIEGNLSEMAQLMRHYQENREAATRIREEAYRLVCAHHTWDHRAAEILADLGA